MTQENKGKNASAFEARPYSYAEATPVPFQSDSGSNHTVPADTSPKDDKIKGALDILLSATDEAAKSS